MLKLREGQVNKDAQGEVGRVGLTSAGVHHLHEGRRGRGRNKIVSAVPTARQEGGMRDARRGRRDRSSLRGGWS